MSKRTIKTIFTLILSIVMVVAIFLSYITYDKRFFESYEYKTGGAFSSTRELIIKPTQKKKDTAFITDKDGNILRKAPQDRRTELGIVIEDGPIKLSDGEFTPDEDLKNLRRLTKNAPLNSEEILTKENYKISQDIILDKLKRAGIEDFDIKTDTETGDIVLSFSDVNEMESKKLDKVKRIIDIRGEFCISDSKTGKVYLSNEHVRKVTPYKHEIAGVVLEFQFNSKGKEILSDITSKYIKRDRDLTEKELKKLEKEAEKNDTELDITETASLIMTVDEEIIALGTFEDQINTGILNIPLSNETAKMNQEEIEEALKEADEFAAIIRAGVEPIKYEIFKETRLVSPIDKIDIIILISIIGIIILAILVYSIIKYKSNGVLAWYMSLVFLIILFTVSKYTNIAITIPSIIAMITLYLIQYVFTIYVLKDVKNLNNTNIGKNIFLITRNTILIILAGLILTFAKDTNLNSFGQMICLGEILLLTYNAIFAKNILK